MKTDSTSENASFLLNRLANLIVDESLPLKEVEKDLRGRVADIAVRQRGLEKGEVASRCGVTVKSIENYLKESQVNPKSLDREVARVLQDQDLTLEETFEKILPALSKGRSISLDDTKRAIDKLIHAGEVRELPGKRYRAATRPAIRCPANPEAYRELVDQKARDMDYIVLTQKEVTDADVTPARIKRFSRVVADTNLLRIDFTVDVSREELDDFYEKLSAQIARLTMRYEKKKGNSRVRLLLGMRSVFVLLLSCLLCLSPLSLGGDENDSWELDNQNPVEDPLMDDDSWELDKEGKDRAPDDERHGAGGNHDPRLDLPPVFIRGDTNIDYMINIADAITVLQHLQGAEDLACADAGDADDNGEVAVNDAILILEYLYGDRGFSTAGVSAINGAPSVDATDDSLGCSSGLED